MRKIMGFFLAFLMLAGLCGCSSQKAALEGTWTHEGFYDSEAIMELFVWMDLYEEEIALMDPAAIPYLETVTFRADGSYTIACDVEQSTALAEEYYRAALDAFYENRDTLEQCYGVSFGVMSRENFFTFYAEMYGVSGYEGLVDMLTESTVDPQFLAAAAENGTYRVTSRRIYCTPEGEPEQYLDYTLEGDALTLDYAETDKVYMRK